MGSKEKSGKKQGVQGLGGTTTGLMLKRGVLVGKRGGSCTPSPTWRLEHNMDYDVVQQEQEQEQQPQEFLNTTSTLSARKLGANLWEIHPLPFHSMTRKARNHSNKHRRTQQQDNTDILQKAIAGSTHQNRCVRTDDSLSQSSAPSYTSSMEVRPYKHPVTPLRSLVLKEKTGEADVNASKELLKLLNNIWSLEEQHSSNKSLLKRLKSEVEHSRTKMKQLILERQKDKQIIDHLMNRVVADASLERIPSEKDQIDNAAQLLKHDLEEERKLRKHSEILRREQAREISEMKSACSAALEDLEQERKARAFTESLCDEFARGIKDYELVLRSLKHKPEKDNNIRRENLDRLILRVAEAWLDERRQMKMAEAHNPTNGLEKDCLRRHSLESFPLNASAPHAVGNNEHSFGNSLQNQEQMAKAGAEEIRGYVNGNIGGKLSRRHSITGGDLAVEQRVKAGKARSLEVNDPSELEEIQPERIDKGLLGSCGLKLDQDIGTFLRTRSLTRRADRVHPAGIICRENSCPQSICAGHASPVQKWPLRPVSPNFSDSKDSLRWPRGVKDNTLMAKLLEARLEGQNSCAKASRSSI